MGLNPLEKAGWKAGSFPGDQTSGKVMVRYKGPFDFTYLLRTVQRWFEQRRFKFEENRFKETGKNMKVDWNARRDINEFFREDYKIKIQMWHISVKEVIVEGEPRKIFNGLIHIEVSGSVKADRAGFFKGTGFWMRFMRRTIMDARWNEMQAQYLDVMEYRCQDIQTVIKECLNMTTKENASW